MCFHAPSRPRKMDKFLFFSYRNTYKIRHYKKNNGNPNINYFIYEFHSNRNTCLPKQNFELAILLPSRQRFPSAERLIHSDRHEGPTPLHCQNPCCIFEAVDPLASLMVQPSSRWATFLLGPQRQNVGLVPTVHHGRRDSPSRDH